MRYIDLKKAAYHT